MNGDIYRIIVGTNRVGSNSRKVGNFYKSVFLFSLLYSITPFLLGVLTLLIWETRSVVPPFSLRKEKGAFINHLLRNHYGKL